MIVVKDVESHITAELLLILAGYVDEAVYSCHDVDIMTRMGC